MRFSVVIPLYNKAAYLCKSIESVISQAYNDFECIIVDDGSTDSSAEIADGYSAKYQNIRVVHQQNSGVAIARNKGVKESLGDYICFLDADDWWDPNFLLSINETITKIPDAGIYGTNYYYYKHGKKEVRVNIKTGVFDYFKEYSKNLQMPLTSSSVCVPKKIFIEMSGFNPKLKLGEDFDLWIRIALKYTTVFIEDPLAYYNQDVPVNKRTVGNLISPQNHILWNMNYLDEYENNNKILKKLLDNLRTYSMQEYYISDIYHNDSQIVLGKVDWTHQPYVIRLYYNSPIFVLRLYKKFRFFGSKLKSYIFNMIK